MPAPASHTVLVHDAVDLAALAATLEAGQPQELLVLEEQLDQPRFAVRYAGKRRPGHVRLTIPQQKALAVTARIPVVQPRDLLRPWPAQVRRRVFATDAAGSWPAAEPEPAVAAWIIFDDQDAFEAAARRALGLGASGMGSCRISLPPGAWRSEDLWVLHLPAAPRFVLLTAQEGGYPVLVHESTSVLVPWGCRLVLPAGSAHTAPDGHMSLYLHPGASRIDVPTPRTTPISALVQPQAGVPLCEQVAAPQSPPEPFRVRVGIYPSHSPRDARLWLLRGPYAHAAAERVLEAVPQDEYAAIQVAVLTDQNDQHVIVLRESRQGQGRAYFDFGASAVQLAPLVGLPNLHIPCDMEVLPVLDRSAMTRIFGLEASRHTLVLPSSPRRHSDPPASYDVLTVRELDFAPLGSLIQHILHASRDALRGMVARAVFNFASFIHALPAAPAPAPAPERSHEPAPRRGNAASPQAPEPEVQAPASDNLDVAAPAEPAETAASPSLADVDEWEDRRKALLVVAHDNNDLASWQGLMAHMEVRAARTHQHDRPPAWVLRDWLDAAIQVCFLDPSVQSPCVSDTAQAAEAVRATVVRVAGFACRRIVASLAGVDAAHVGLTETILCLDKYRHWMTDLPAFDAAKPDPAQGRAVGHRDAVNALALLLGTVRWSSGSQASVGDQDPFCVAALPELYDDPDVPGELPRTVQPPNINNLLRCVSAKVGVLFGAMTRSGRSPWCDLGHAVASEHCLRRVSRHGSGPLDEISVIRNSYLQGLVGAGSDQNVGGAADLIRWLGDVVAGRRASVDVGQGVFDPYMAQAADIITAYGLSQLGLVADASALLEPCLRLCESGFAAIPGVAPGAELYAGDELLPGVFGAYALLAIQGNAGRVEASSDAGRWLGRLAATSRRSSNCATENLTALRDRLELVRTADPEDLWQRAYAQAERVFSVSHGYHYLDSVWPRIRAAATENDASQCAELIVAALRGLPLLPKAQATRRGQSLGMGEAGCLLLRLRRLIPQLGIAAAVRPGLDYVQELIGTSASPGVLGEINMSNGLMRTHLAGCLAASGETRAASGVLVELCNRSWQNHRVSQLLDLYEVLLPAASIISGLPVGDRESAFMALVAASHIDRPLTAGGRNQVQIYRTNRARMIQALVECVASKANRVEGLSMWMAQDEVHYLAPGALLRG